MLEWIGRKHETAPDRPMSDPGSAASLLAELRGAEPVDALNELQGRIESLRDERDGDDAARGDVLSLIEETGTEHVAALLAQYFTNSAAGQLAHDSVWKVLYNYVSALAGARGKSAQPLMKAAGTDAAGRARAAAAVVHALRACRLLAKLCLMRYLSVPPKLWRLAYALHAGAERGGYAAAQVSLHAAHKSGNSAGHAVATTSMMAAVTSAAQELLRLLMLQVAAPEMMSPEQIEAADRVLEQLGEQFTLRPHGVADNPFCFDPGGDAPPRRAAGHDAAPEGAARHFGPGMGYDSLERMYRQLQAARPADIKVLGKDLAPHVQIGAVQHLLTFWRADSGYAPPAHQPAAGSVQIRHRFGQIWQHISQVRSSGGGLSLLADDAIENLPPETWALRDAGGNELGTEIPQLSGSWAKCGELVAVSPRGDGECWVGLIRRMHAQLGHGVHADIAVLSRAPQALSLRAILERGEESAFTEASSRQFAFNAVHAIVLEDGADGAHKPNLLVPTEHWKPGRVFETTIDNAPRYLRVLQQVRRGEDYVRATFEWVQVPQAGNA